MRIFKSFPPLNKTDITSIQEELKVKLPIEYSQFLMTKHAYTIFTNWLKIDEGDLYFHNFLHGSKTDDINYKTTHFVDFNKRHMESYKGYLAIAKGYAHDAYLLKLDEPNLGYIYYYKLGMTIEEGVLNVANSFKEFFEILIDNKNYRGQAERYTNIFNHSKEKIKTDKPEDKSNEINRYILYYGHYSNHPVRLIGGTYEFANDIALQYEYNSIIKSGQIGIYAMEPNTLLSHIDLAKYLEIELDNEVTYIREDTGLPQILWDYPKPKNLQPENVKDIIEITNFRTYHLINVNEFSKGDYIICFSDEMGFSNEGVPIDAYVHEDYASAEIEALKLVLMACSNHIAKIDEYKTRTDDFTNLVEKLEYFRYNDGYCIFEANIESQEIGNFTDQEIEALKNELKSIWKAIGKETYTIEQL